MGTKITLIAMGLAIIVSGRDYLISRLDNNKDKHSSLQTVKEAFLIVKLKFRERQRK